MKISRKTLSIISTILFLLAVVAMIVLSARDAEEEVSDRPTPTEAAEEDSVALATATPTEAIAEATATPTEAISEATATPTESVAEATATPTEAVAEATATPTEAVAEATATPTPTKAPAAAKTYKFRSKKLLDQHYEKHGKDMGFASAKEYEAAASDVINNPAALHKKEKDDGDYVYYVEATNEFVVLSTDGYIRTYFLPDRGKAYYDKQ